MAVRSLLKVPLLIAIARGIHVGFSPPQPSPGDGESYSSSGGQDETLPAVGRWGLVPLKAVTFFASALEAYLLIAREYPATRSLPPLSALLSFAPGAMHSGRLGITSATLVGATLVVGGAWLRRTCFHLLGRHFTFELSIKKNHELITQGPYSVVRHPGYSALILQAAGLLICMGGPGSWWKEYGAATRVGKWFAGLLLAQIATCLFVGIDRSAKEDAMLQGLFKEQWDEWAKRTPYRLIPYVY